MTSNDFLVVMKDHEERNLTSGGPQHLASRKRPTCMAYHHLDSTWKKKPILTQHFRQNKC